MLWNNPRGQVFSKIADVIGGTPLVELHKITDDLDCKGLITAKCEFISPGLSVKDRICKSMIEGALEAGELSHDSVCIEATSGNTGIGLAMICASLGIRCVLTMPESMSIERRKVLQHLGAELHLTPAAGGMKAAIEKANELAQEHGSKAYLPKQFENPRNPLAHELSTAQEIIADLGTEGLADTYAIVIGVGTGGSLTGIASVLKEHKNAKHIKIIAVEPSASPVLSGGKPGPHKIMGIGAGFTPQVLKTKLIDSIITVANEEAFEYAKLAASKEGVLCGISSGANLKAAIEVARRPEAQGKRVIVILPSASERYVSTPLFESRLVENLSQKRRQSEDNLLPQEKSSRSIDNNGSSNLPM
ncbi:hypothetical protein P9112_007727 [Eukaryota sp. TZLM1-RC]